MKLAAQQAAELNGRHARVNLTAMAVKLNMLCLLNARMKGRQCEMA